jgi:hypothetical protein
MTDQSYLKRRAAQETALASKATNSRVAAAHDALAAAYLRQLAKLAEMEEWGLQQQRPAQL